MSSYPSKALISLSLLVTSTAFGQSPSATSGDGGESALASRVVGEEVAYEVRTTIRGPQYGFSSDRSSNLVDEEAMEARQPTSITDALDEEVGVFVQSTNRGAGTVVVRGRIGTENLVVVDGVRFNQATFRTGPIQYLNTLDPWAFGSIEVTRGPGSFLYGSDALGGVLTLHPSSYREPMGHEVRGKLFASSADSTIGAGVSAAVQGESSGAYLGATFRNHAELRPGSSGGRSIVAANEAGGRLAGSDFRESFFRAGARHELDLKQTVRIDYMDGLVDAAPRSDRIGAGEWRTYRNRDQLLWSTYESQDVGFWDALHLNVSMHRTEETVDRSNCSTDDGVARSPVACARADVEELEKTRKNVDGVTTLGSSLSVHHELEGLGLDLQWGADVYRDHVDESRRIDARAPDFEASVADRANFREGSTFTRMGAFTFAEKTFDGAVNALVLRAGARVDRSEAFAPDVSPELGDVDYRHVGVVGSAGISWLYDATSNLYLNFSQGFRTPNLQETTVLGDTGNTFEVPNEALGPERSHTLELGNKLDLEGWFRSEAALWGSLLTDAITREDALLDGASEIDGKPVQQRVNRDTAYYYGVDATLQTYPIVWDTSLFGKLTWIDGAVETSDDDPSFIEGPLHRLLGQADHYENPRRLAPMTWIAGATYSPNQTWYATFFARGAGAQDKIAPGDRSDLRICEASPGVLFQDIDGECQGSEGWTTLNLRGGYRGDAARLDVSLENLFDQRYRNHGSGYLAPGFDARITLTVFER